MSAVIPPPIPFSLNSPRIPLMHAVRACGNRCLTQCTISLDRCSSVFTGTKRMFGCCAASPLRRFADRRRVGRVVLAPFGAHMVWGHQLGRH